MEEYDSCNRTSAEGQPERKQSLPCVFCFIVSAECDVASTNEICKNNANIGPTAFSYCTPKTLWVLVLLYIYFLLLLL